MTLSRENRSVGIGPMCLSDEWMAGNQRSVIKTVLEYVNAACRAYKEPNRYLADVQPGEWRPYYVISLVGKRGSGKTSMLMSIINRIREQIPEALVTDIIQPDIIKKSFPFAPIVANSIQAALLETPSGVSKESQDKVFRELKSLSWVLDNRPEGFGIMSRNSMNLQEWNTFVFDIMNSPTQYIQNFHAWVERAIILSRKKVAVVPIDDADISIEKAEEVIDTIRTYFATPRIITIMALDIPSLERKIRNLRLTALPEIPGYSNEDKEQSYLHGLSVAKFRSREAEEEQSYVEHLLAKVLPPAGRVYLTGLSGWERVYKPFKVPGRENQSSVSENLRMADAKAPHNSGIDIAPVVEAHPDILSENIRLFVNQNIMICEACERYISEVENFSAEEKREMMEDFRHEITTQGIFEHEKSTTKHRSRLEIYPVDTPDQLLRSKLQMSIVRAFLSDPKFAPILLHISQEKAVSVERFISINDFVNFLLLNSSAYGSSDSKLLYNVAGKRLEDPKTSRIVDFAIDWAIGQGASVSSIMTNINLFISPDAFRPVPVPRRLSKKLSANFLNKIDSNIQLVDQAFEDYVGAQIVVTSDRDKLMPIYIKDSNAIGLYKSLVINYNRIKSYEKDAKHFVKALDSTKDKDIRQDDLRSAFYRVMGLLSL